MVAHRRCNNDKRDALAAAGHLARWWDRFVPGTRTERRVAAVAAELPWPRRSSATAGAARALYLHQVPGVLLWARQGTVEPLDMPTIGAILHGRAEPTAAEERGPYVGEGP